MYYWFSNVDVVVLISFFPMLQGRRTNHRHVLDHRARAAERLWSVRVLCQQYRRSDHRNAVRISIRWWVFDLDLICSALAAVRWHRRRDIVKICENAANIFRRKEFNVYDHIIISSLYVSYCTYFYASENAMTMCFDRKYVIVYRGGVWKRILRLFERILYV